MDYHIWVYGAGLRRGAPIFPHRKDRKAEDQILPWSRPPAGGWPFGEVGLQ